MPEPAGWLIDVESKPRLFTSDDMAHTARVLKDFSRALRADQTLHSVNPSADMEAGMLRASMTIEEPRQGHAEEIAIAAFFRGLEAAGFRTQMPGWELNVRVLGPLPNDAG